MEREKRLAVSGIDSRAKYMLATLKDRGYECLPLSEAAGCLAAVLPMPYSQDGVTVKDTGLSLARFFSSLPRGYVVLGGRLDREAYLHAMDCGVRLFDYFTPESVQIGNAALTAKGAIALTKDSLDKPGVRVLVCGFGRIGKCLAHYLSVLGIKVSVSARREEDLAWIGAMGYDAVRTCEIDPAPFDLIYNTVPYRVLGKEKLERVKPTVHILDLASAPFGTDFAVCSDLGIRAGTAPALPGRMYPEEAGTLLGHSVLKILEREGVG